MENVKNEDYWAICFRPIAQNENIACRVNPIENAISDVCCVECFNSMEEDHYDYC